MLVETALAYARKIGDAENVTQAREFARVIVEQLEELNAKIERRKRLTSEQEKRRYE